MRSKCPTEADLLAFIENRLGWWRRRRTLKHISRCGQCSDAVAYAVREGSKIALPAPAESFLESVKSIAARI